MKTPLITGALAALVLVLAGCNLPFTTPEQTLSIPYSTFVPSFAKGIPLVTGLPAFADQPAPPVNLPLPAEAKKVNVQTVTLALRMRNTGPLPLRITLFLASQSNDPYSAPPLGGPEGTLDLPRDGGIAEKVFPIDVTLLQGEQMRLGYKFGSPGTQQTVTFKDADRVEIAYKLSVTAKLF